MYFKTKLLGFVAVLFLFVLFLRCTSLNTLLLLLYPFHSAVFAFTVLTSKPCVLYAVFAYFTLTTVVFLIHRQFLSIMGVS